MEESIQSLDKLRAKAAMLLVIMIITSVAVTVLCFVVILRDFGKTGFYLSIALGAGFWYLLGKVTGFFKLSNEFKYQFKATFVEIPFRNSFSDVFYCGIQGFDQEVIERTGIMSLGNIYHSNDYVQGYYKDVKFERADVKIQQRVNTGKSSVTITYLHGRWLIFEFNKNFHFDLQIIGDGFPVSHNKSSIFTEEEERRHRIKLEDIGFNHLFKVFCQNDHEAYYILTPQFMSVLKDLNTSIDGSIMLGFIDNQLHIAIHNEKDAMEPRIFSKIDLDAVKEEVDREINIIIKIIDSLDLDREIF